MENLFNSLYNSCMATRKTKKRSSKKNKPKVKLDSKKVYLLSGVILSLCVVFLILNVIFTSSPAAKTDLRSKSSESAVAKMGTEAYQKKSEIKSQENQTVKVPVQPKKTESEVKPFKVESNKNSGAENIIVPKTTVSSQNSVQSSKTASTAQKTSASTVNTTAQTQKTQSSQIKTQSPIASVQTPEKKQTEKLPQKYTVPKAVNNAKIAFVIDDGGLNVANVKRYTSLPFPITIAVLPKLSHSKDCAYVVRSSGKELILHQPMQSMNLNMNPGPGAITPDMSLSEIRSMIEENIAELGAGVKGFNNHEGSLITTDEMKIGAALDVAVSKGIYFLDSRTSVDTQAPSAALERNIEIKERDIFIDNEISKDAMLKEIYRGLNVANKKGKAIMIGHVDKSVNILPDLLSDLYPYLVAAGWTVTTPSKIN